MSIKENLKSIVNELDTNTLSIDYEAFNNLTDQITHAKRIFLCGKGRSGLAISAFANRLMHLGLDVALVGEITAPRAKEGDLLIIGSGSGETGSLISLANKAKSEQVKIALITTNSESTIGKMADCVITLPCASKLDNNSKQPMASAFEQLSFMTYDAIVMELMSVLNQNADDMFQRHANFE